jgi:hypothetical protein
MLTMAVSARSAAVLAGVCLIGCAAPATGVGSSRHAVGFTLTNLTGNGMSINEASKSNVLNWINPPGVGTVLGFRSRGEWRAWGPLARKGELVARLGIKAPPAVLTIYATIDGALPTWSCRTSEPAFTCSSTGTTRRYDAGNIVTVRVKNFVVYRR